MSPDGIGVCHVITRLDLGGAQENTLYTVEHLRPPFRASLVSGPGGLLDEEAGRIAGLDLSFVPSLARPIRPHRDLAALAALTRLLRRTRPAIVHTHSSKAGILGRLAARLAGVPVVVHTIHGYGFNDEQPAVLRRLFIRLERSVAPLTSRFIAVSRANLDRGVDLGLFPRHRAILIRSGIPLASFERAGAMRRSDGLRAELRIPDNAPLVGMIACLKPQKAPLDFVEVAARVARLIPEAVFVLAGDGELRGRVQERIDRLSLRDRIRLLGWRRDVPRLLAALDVMLLTSLWEGLPRVVPEAIAAGVPVVATAVDGTTDILKEGETGMVCAPHDLDGLAARVERLLRDRAFANGLVARARAILPEFDIDAMVRSQERLYLDLLEAAGRLPRRAA